jgi:cobalt-zinc-cadmium efflux system membrane fusion protein
MDRKNMAALALVGLVAAAGGLAVGSAIWGDAPAAEEHAEGEEHSKDEGHEEGEAATPGFVALAPNVAATAGVEVTTVARGGGAELILPGRVTFAPNAEASVGAPLEGVVETVHVALGSRIGAGAPLVTIRSPEGASMRASADAARADAEAAQAAFRREARLFEARVTARQDWEAARAAALRANANVRAAQARITASGSPEADGRTIIRSPIAGTVTVVGAAPGGFVAQGASVAQVADQGRVELIFDAPAAASRDIRPGTAIYATGASGEEVRATVTSVSPNPATAGAQVRARPTGFVPPAGTPVSGRALTAAQAALVVPSEAVQTVDGRPVVFVAEANGFRARPVVAGRMAAGRTEILRGLREGERIAGRGAFLLKAELSKGEAEHEH